MFSVQTFEIVLYWINQQRRCRVPAHCLQKYIVMI